MENSIIKRIGNFFLNILEVIAIIIATVPLVLIYAPLRSLYKRFSKRFLKRVIEPRPYQGNVRMFKRLDKHIIGDSKYAQKNRVFIYFLLPSLSAFIFFVIIPFFMGIYYSFTDWEGLSDIITWIGFKNYEDIFTDYAFVYSFFRTIQYSFMSVIFVNLFAFGIALLVTQKLKFKNVYRAGFFMPNLIGGLVLGYIWKFVYSSALPAISESLGPNLSLNADTAMGAIIAVVVWQYAGYIMMIYIAALQNVPQDLIEASKIDGASAWQRLKAITLPLVAQAFTISLFLTLVTSFKQFDTVIALTNGAPAALLPEWIQSFLNESSRSILSMNLMAIDVYNTGWVESEFAVGQAKAVVFFIFLLIVSIVQVTYNKRREVEL
jgi:raffinose/stachyose/melibiose transport system permease protein